jgi:hypothetical protein
MPQFTVTDSTGKRYSLDLEAESLFDAARLLLARAKEHVIREPLPIPCSKPSSRLRGHGERMSPQGLRH